MIRRLLSLCLIYFLLFQQVYSSTLNRFKIQRPDSSFIDFYIKKHLSVPESDSILLVIHGSDCNSVLNLGIIDKLEYAWPSADLLLVEKYGITSDLVFSGNEDRKDCPPAYIKRDNLDQRVSDILQVLGEIRASNSYLKYLIIGGSEGAVVANIVSSLTEYIDATVSFNGGGRWFIDDVKHSIKYEREITQELQTEITEITEMTSQILSNPDIDVKISGHGSSWWQSVLTFDNQKVLQSVESPILIIQSQKDQSVSANKTDTMVQFLITNGKENIDYKKYDGLNHTFQTDSGESKFTDILKDINIWFGTKL